MARPEVPDQLPCPECGEPSKVLPHSPFRFPGIDPLQTRVVQYDEHWRQKVDVDVDVDANEIVLGGGENQ